jgi:2'-5' RNA ligase
MNFQRVFFALKPDDSVRQQIAAVASALPTDNGKPIAEANLHLTLVFLGAVPESQLHNIITAATEIPFTEFSLHIDRIGWWQKPAVLWLGCSQAPPALLELAASLRGLIQAQGLPLGNQQFQPHITVAKKVSQAVAGCSFAPTHWRCDSFCLLESVFDTSGVEYRLLHKWPKSQT